MFSKTVFAIIASATLATLGAAAPATTTAAAPTTTASVPTTTSAAGPIPTVTGTPGTPGNWGEFCKTDDDCPKTGAIKYHCVHWNFFVPFGTCQPITVSSPPANATSTQTFI